VTQGEAAPQTRAAARAQGEGAAQAPTRKRRFHWVRAASDRVPTRWFAGIGTGLLLAVTAAFGGLATAAVPSIVTIEPGAEHRNAQFALRVESAQLRDEDPDARIYLEDGERMLTVRVRVENLWTRPSTATDLSANVSVAGVPGEDSGTVRRVDDSTIVSFFQPNVPAEVEYRWVIGDDDLRGGDTLEVTLNDLTEYTGSFVASGTWWTDPKPAARLTLTIDDTATGSGS
jgi:hypothetical protein